MDHRDKNFNPSKKAVLIHGTPSRKEFYGHEYLSPSNCHWFPWLQREMLQAGYATQAPEMPSAVYPNYLMWKETFEYFPIEENNIYVGHSCGGGFLLRYFSEHKKPVKRVVLVAPWLDPENEKDPLFFDFEIDANIVNRTDLHILASDNDDKDIIESVKIIKEKIPGIKIHEFHNYGHFCINDMKTEEFPELRDIVLKN